MIPQTCRKHALNIPETCPKHAPDMPQTWPKDVPNIPQTCPKHAPKTLRMVLKNIDNDVKKDDVYIHSNGVLQSPCITIAEGGGSRCSQKRYDYRISHFERKPTNLLKKKRGKTSKTIQTKLDNEMLQKSENYMFFKKIWIIFYKECIIL